MTMSVLENSITNRDVEYLKSKGWEVALIARNTTTGEVCLRSEMNESELISLLKKEGSAKSAKSTWVSEDQKKGFPKSPGKLEEIFKSKKRLESYASLVMKFWKRVVCFEKMGVGVFKAWDQFNIDMGTLDLLTEQVQRIHVGSFNIRMVDILEWGDLEGIHGLATGNAEKVKVDWSWFEVLRFFILWSYTVVGISCDGTENVNEIWSPNAEDFVQPKKKMFFKTSSKVKTQVQKRPSKPVTSSAVNGQSQMADDYELGMALSVSDEIERERVAERASELQDLNLALDLSRCEPAHVSPENVEKLPEDRY